jgi:endoglucanase
MKRNYCLLFFAVALLFLVLSHRLEANAANSTVDVTIDTSQNRNPISLYIYGTNATIPNTTFTATRIGGNRLVGYNWENNCSNAGKDYQNSNDTYLLNEIPANRRAEPGVVALYAHETNQAQNIPYTLMTLQAAGYVAADSCGTVFESETPPSSRWKQVQFTKGSAFAVIPDTTDNSVYMDEFVHYLVTKFGTAASGKGIKGYAITNEPGLWNESHPRLHPNKVTCAKLVTQSVGLATAVKRIDPDTEIFGPVLYGFNAFDNLQNAPDWSNYCLDYTWFITYYLDQLRQASQKAGQRLLDVLDLHWYPEAIGGGSRIVYDQFRAANIECNKARMQAPRTLWDESYIENSWIGQYRQWGLPLIPKLQTTINRFYPQTKLAFTEYCYGGEGHISGGIAEADLLGIFGKYGVYMANFWRRENDSSYISAAFNLYTNYDGKGATFENTSVRCAVSDTTISSAYAATAASHDQKLHIILINKNYNTATTFNIKVNTRRQYSSGKVYGFDGTGATISARAPVGALGPGNTFSYTLPALSAYHLVLE